MLGNLNTCPKIEHSFLVSRETVRTEATIPWPSFVPLCVFVILIVFLNSCTTTIMMKSITQDSSDTHAYTQNFEHFLQLRKILQQMKRGTYLWKWEYDNTVTVRFFCLDTLQSLSWTDPDGKESTDSGNTEHAVR